MIHNSRIPWPVQENGEPEEPAFLCHMHEQDMADEIRMNMLETYGIPCLRTYPGDGAFGKVILGMSGEGACLFVPASMLEDAQALCEPPEETEE